MYFVYWKVGNVCQKVKFSILENDITLCTPNGYTHFSKYDQHWSMIGLAGFADVRYAFFKPTHTEATFVWRVWLHHGLFILHCIYTLYCPCAMISSYAWFTQIFFNMVICPGFLAILQQSDLWHSIHHKQLKCSISWVCLCTFVLAHFLCENQEDISALYLSSWMLILLDAYNK